MATFEVRAGDTDTVLEVQLTRRDGTLQPLAGSEQGSFIFSTWDGTDLTAMTKTLVISDAPTSKVKATLVAGDTSARKGQVLRCRVPVTFAGGIETFPTAPDELLVVIY